MEITDQLIEWNQKGYSAQEIIYLLMGRNIKDLEELLVEMKQERANYKRSYESKYNMPLEEND